MILDTEGLHIQLTAEPASRPAPWALRSIARLGLRHEGTAREADWFKGEWTSLETWAVLASER